MSGFFHPATHVPLVRAGEVLRDPAGASFPIIAEVPRFCEIENYTASFGKQWNQFVTTQIDGEGVEADVSRVRFFAETGWSAESLAGQKLLEVGSGAGRFSRVVLAETGAELSSVDYSAAVEANWRNNSAIAPGRFHLAQASVYEMPFPDGHFDKVFCLGVLQHTPDFAASVRALVAKARVGGEIVVDFYPIRGWWTKLHAKYLLRPVTKRMTQERLLALIERNAGRMERLVAALERTGLGALRRFVPLVDPRTLPADLTPQQRHEWLVLDTFDMFSPAHDHPQRVSAVARMFEQAGAEVTFAGYVNNGIAEAAVVRGIRK
jgi:2-polyprenyl-3-methyl-5-hydroxy-6-metoxy-1,4-benzoquinol methylase